MKQQGSVAVVTSQDLETLGDTSRGTSLCPESTAPVGDSVSAAPGFAQRGEPGRKQRP